MKSNSIGHLKTVKTDAKDDNCLSKGASVGIYVISELIGSGGMGKVYLAKNKDTGASVAVKVLLEELAEDEIFAGKFRKEIQFLSELNHKNIVKLIDHGYDESVGSYYFAMEYISGSDNKSFDLQRLIESVNLSLDDKEKIILQICSALEYAHTFSKGCIIHRDLKPSNILLNSENNVYISDFGISEVAGNDFIQTLLARSIGSFTTRNFNKTSANSGREKVDSEFSLLGTYEYMSPELQEGGEASVRSDIYSLGLIIYFLLTGKKAKGRFPSCASLNIPRKWDTVINKCLDEDPQKRFKSVSAIIEVIKESYKDVSVHDIEFAENIKAVIDNFQNRCEKLERSGIRKKKYRGRAFLVLFRFEEKNLKKFSPRICSTVNRFMKHIDKIKAGTYKPVVEIEKMSRVLDHAYNSYQRMSTANCSPDYVSLKFSMLEFYESMFSSLYEFRDTLTKALLNPQKATKHGVIHISGAIECKKSIAENMYREYKRLTGMNLYDETNCFIATACFGPDSQEVMEFRRFRDESLIHYSAGRVFIKLYYKISPAISKILKFSPTLTNITSKSLSFILKYIRQN
ncbi:MAG: serine/threonine protein kinase [bacterium]|nr:serine/threonine protein kinase [bacterium]